MRRIKCGPHHPTAAASEQANTGPTRKEQHMTGSMPVQRPSRRPRAAAWRVVALAPALLAGCANFGSRQGTYTCPAATTIPELQTMVQVVSGPNGATVQSSGRVSTVTTTCDREGDNGVVSYLTVDFTGLRTTPAVNRLDLPYFVAMADANGNILGKQQYVIGLAFDPAQPVTKAADDVTVHIPLANAQLGNIYTLVVGFQLNQSQLDYNRAHLQ
jgi:hypothetical protein